jgi:short-subunit dehydrogenase
MTQALNQTALITGGSTGIGAVYANRLARRGYDLILVARDQARMDTLAERLRADTGRTIEVVRADLTDSADLARVAARFADDPSIGLLVNNAGLSMTGDVISSGPGEVERLIALNITAPTVLAGAAGKAFVARGEGAIINLASVLALLPEMFDGVYSGSKAYLLNLSQSLSAQYGAKGLYVQAVLPGATRTEIWERSGKDIDSFPADWVMDAGDLVDAALAGFDRRETITIPPLADADLPHWQDLQAARAALDGKLSRRDVAERYREPALA